MQIPFFTSFFKRKDSKTSVESPPIESKAFPLVTWNDPYSEMLEKQLHPYYGVVSGVYYAMTGMPWLSSDARKAVKTEWFWQPIRGQPRRVDTNELRKYANTIWVQSIVMTILKQIATVPWDIVPLDEETPYEIVEEEIKNIKEFFDHPNKNNDSLGDLLSAWIKDVLEIDAGVLVKVYSIDSYDFEHLEPRSGAPLLKPLICPECMGNKIVRQEEAQRKAARVLDSISKSENSLPEAYQHPALKEFSYNLIKPDYSKIKTKMLEVISYNLPGDANAIDTACPFCNGTGIGRHITEIYAYDGASFLKDSDRTGWTYGYWQYCMSGKNLVETNNGVKKISEVEIGDSVLSDNGEWNKVLDKYERVYDGEFIKIKAQGMPEIECTTEHPFLVNRNKKEEWTEAGQIQTTDFLMAVSEKNTIENISLPLFDENSFEAKQKRNHEKILCLHNLTGYGCKILSKQTGINASTINLWLKGKQTPKCSDLPWSIELNEETSELFGWYLAEGCAPKGSIVNFTLSFTENEEAERIKHLMKKYFGLDCSIARQDNIQQLRFFNKVLAQWFLRNFYKGKTKNAKTKSIPEFLMNANQKEQKAMLGAFIQGDGCITPAEARATTASATLAFDLRRIAIRLGAYPTLCYSKPYSHEFKGRIISSSGWWSFVLNTNAMRNIIIGLNENQDAKQKTVQIEFGKFLVPIQKIEKETKIEKVYNIHVETRNNYTANGFINHNSYAIPAHPMWFNKDEIIYYMANPRGISVYGYSPLQSSLETVKALEYSLKHNLALFIDGAVPDGVVGVEDMDNEELKRMKIQWENELKGQPHKVLFLNKKTSFVPFTFNNRDMQFLEGQKESWKQVMSNFGVSSEDLGIFESSNRATAGTAVETGRRKAIRPILSKVEEILNEQLLPDLGAVNVRFKFVLDDPVEERMKAELNEIYLRAGIKSVNEVRLEMGLPPVEWGDSSSNFMQGQFGEEEGEPGEEQGIKDTEEAAEEGPMDARQKDYQFPFQAQVPFVTTIQNLSTPLPFAVPKRGHPNTQFPYKEMNGLCPGCGSQAIMPVGEVPGGISVSRWYQCQSCHRSYTEEQMKGAVEDQQRMHETNESTDVFTRAKPVMAEIGDVLAPKVVREINMSPTAPIPNLVPTAGTGRQIAEVPSMDNHTGKFKPTKKSKVELKKKSFENIIPIIIQTKLDEWLGFESAPLYAFVRQFIESYNFNEVTGGIRKRKKLKSVFTEAFYTGMNLRQLAGEIEAIGFDAENSEAIARTETIRIANEAKLLQAESKDYKKVMFTATLDNVTCKKCKELDGKVFGIKKAQGMIPLHPFCRCSWRVMV